MYLPEWYNICVSVRLCMYGLMALSHPFRPFVCNICLMFVFSIIGDFISFYFCLFVYVSLLNIFTNSYVSHTIFCSSQNIPFIFTLFLLLRSDCELRAGITRICQDIIVIPIYMHYVSFGVVRKMQLKLERDQLIYKIQNNCN